MNAERLHAIAIALFDEMRNEELVERITNLRDSLWQSVNEPANANPQQQVSEMRSQLDDSLARAPSNGFSPAWRGSLEEMHIADLVGNSLRERIGAIFDSNTITPSSAVDQLDPLVDRTAQLFTALENTLNGLSFLSIGAEELQPGEVEIGFLIPRGFVKEELELLGREFMQLQRILIPFAEVATGRREPIKVRTIASSGFAAFLESTPTVALVIASTVDRLIAAYKNVLEIKKLRQEAKAAGASTRSLNALQSDAEGSMEKTIGILVTQLLEQAKVDDTGRKNELGNELRVSLNAIANRIDAGFSVEVRVGELPPGPDVDAGEPPESKADAERRRVVSQVQAKQESLQFINTMGEQILGLPEPENLNNLDDHKEKPPL